MTFWEQPPSTQWVALKLGDAVVAEVWFKPADRPLALTFRVPHTSFQLPGLAEQLTAESLLGVVGLTAEEVESWRLERASRSGMGRSYADLRQPLPPPSQLVTHLTMHVALKQPPPVATEAEDDEPLLPVDPPGKGDPVVPVDAPEKDESAPSVAPAGDDQPFLPLDLPENDVPLLPLDSAEIAEPGIPEETWQELEGRWKAIEGVEAAVDTLRIRLEGLRADMENLSRKTLTAEEKVHALGADMSRWNKTRSRVHYATPKVREFIHRATWAAGTPERKRLEELFKNDARPDIPLAEVDKLREELENLLKDRQVLSANGVLVRQECEGITTDMRTALRTLQSNAAARARKNAHASRGQGKFFKDVRRLSGAD